MPGSDLFEGRLAVLAFAACAPPTLPGMEASRRDGTDEWVLPENSRPPSVKELEARIDVALSRARSAETAASAIGAAALDAAEQARRSAAAAERTHKLAGERLGFSSERDPREPSVPLPRATAHTPVVSNEPSAAGAGAVGQGPVEEAGSEVGKSHREDPMQAFIARADQISLRLQRLQGTPLSATR